jgi:hypothetical protein
MQELCAHGAFLRRLRQQVNDLAQQYAAAVSEHETSGAVVQVPFPASAINVTGCNVCLKCACASGCLIRAWGLSLLPQRNVKVAEALTEEAQLKLREAQRLAQEWDAAKQEALAAAQVLP